MTTLLIIIVSIQIILYLILLYSVKKMIRVEIENNKKRMEQMSEQYKEYMTRRKKVWNLLNKKPKNELS